jgi:TP901 family phage tail tape measure protein
LDTQIKTTNGGVQTFTTTSTSLWSQFTGGGNVIQGLAMRFVGLQAILGMAQKGFQELKQWVDEGVKAFRSFEVQMASINAILTDTTRSALPAMNVAITQLSVNYGKSVTDLADSLRGITQAGFSVTNAMGILVTSTKLAIAGNIDLKAATETLDEVLNAYGMTAAHAQEISDKLFQTMARGQLTLDSLQSSLGYILPIAAEMGVSFDQISAAISTATRAGQHIDSVTRGLGLMLQGFGKQTKVVSDAMLKYGIDASYATIQSEGFFGVMKQINAATNKYGTQILPELIGNMRSLRVAMALTSDSGIKGMTDDMDYLKDSTGRTDDALTSMMNTQQKLADILEQSMQKVERSIGEAWSGVDIWWKKSQLWWGTLFSGGDADKAVNNFDSAVEKIRQSYIKNIIGLTSQKNISTIFTGFGKETPILKTVTEYNQNAKDIEDTSKLASTAYNAKTVIASLQAQAKKGIMNSDELKLLDSYFKELNLTMTYSYNTEGILDTNTINFSRTTKDLQTKIDNLINSLDTLTAIENISRDNIDAIKSSFDDAQSGIIDFESTILTLKSEIKDLNTTMEDNTTKLSLMKAKQPMEEFQEAAKMAMTYGPQYINQWTNVTDIAGNSMNTVLQTIYEYNSALEETKKETEKVTQANHDLQIQMQYNNLQELKIELTGMMRRRGNTRAEQRELKQLNIENTKLRIQELQTQYTADVANNEAINNSKETAYDEAMGILQGYTDFEQHQLFILEDTRQADIDNLQETINYEIGILDLKKQTLENDYKEMETDAQKYVTKLFEISSDPILTSAYEQLTGRSAFEDAMNAYQEYLDFIKNNPIPGGGSSALSKPIMTSSTGNFNWSGIGPSPRTLINGKLTGYADGIDYVPETGIYKLHEGEKVISANKNNGGNITININNPTVQNPADISKLANTLENVVRANLTDKNTGKSKYRMS